MDKKQDVAEKVVAEDVIEQDQPTTEKDMSTIMSFDEFDDIEQSVSVSQKVSKLFYQFQMIVENIMASDVPDKIDAVINAVSEFSDRLGNNYTEKSSEDKPGRSSGILIYKDTDSDIYRWIISYSNKFEDKEKEIITDESHRKFDEMLSKKEVDMPELQLWHIPIPIGETVVHTYSDGFVTAAGNFYKEFDYIAEALQDNSDWNGASHCMPNKYMVRDPDNPNLITSHIVTEISILPAKNAANPFAFSIIKEKGDLENMATIPKNKEKEFRALMGDEDFENYISFLNKKEKETEGVNYKETDENEQPTDFDSVNFDDMAKMISALVGKIDELETRISGIVGQKQERGETKEITYEGMRDYVKKHTPIGDPSVRVDGRTKEASAGPKEKEQEVVIGGANLSNFPLIAQFQKRNYEEVMKNAN